MRRASGTYSVFLLGTEHLHRHRTWGHAWSSGEDWRAERSEQSQASRAGAARTPHTPALYRRGQRPGAWGPGAAAVPTLSGQWRRRPHKGAGPLAHAKLPVNWRGHNGRSPRSRWAARHNVRAVGTRSPSLASRGLMLRAPRLNMLPFPRPRGGGEGRKECSPLLSLLPSHSPETPHRWLAEATGAEKWEFYNEQTAASRRVGTLPSWDLLPTGTVG